MDASRVSRSPLRWAGSKKKLLPHLLTHVPKAFDRYLEPFCGSLCLYVAIQPKKALVGDINDELIHFYRMMRWRPRRVAEITHQFPSTNAAYYRIRGLDPYRMTAERRAARFLYLNRYCFNGVYRTNLTGEFNVSRGQHMGGIPSVDELVAFGSLMRRANVRTCDFSSLLQQAGPGDFIYMDPPYAGRDVRDRGEYGLGAFKQGDIDRMTQGALSASRRGAKILISYADTAFIRRAFRNWNVTDLEVDRNVSGFTRGRAKVAELLIRNYN